MTRTHPVVAKTVIIADDTAYVRDRFAAALKGAGHTAVTVASANELLTRMRRDVGHLRCRRRQRLSTCLGVSFRLSRVMSG